MNPPDLLREAKRQVIFKVLKQIYENEKDTDEGRTWVMDEWCDVGELFSQPPTLPHVPQHIWVDVQATFNSDLTEYCPNTMHRTTSALLASQQPIQSSLSNQHNALLGLWRNALANVAQLPQQWVQDVQTAWNDLRVREERLYVSGAVLYLLRKVQTMAMFMIVTERDQRGQVYVPGMVGHELRMI
ncbi:hypothetical protein PMZ80_004862 [Knufia obscura]|uniref:Uncharacterized protein n=1 Tax=Knufia obscura TaxID=1635080 RepID=A0ABR0RNW6_9EURO|nr:hypothetical protein PMZ80_004862 [Knufia obscura]